MKLEFGVWALAWFAIGCRPATEDTTAPQGPASSPTPVDAVSKTRVAVQGDQLFLLGTFDAQTPRLVTEALDRHAGIRTLVFTANGGSVDDDATLALGRRVRARGLDTIVVANGAIASGGVSLFLAGRHRTVERGALIGVHSWEHCWGDADGQEPGCRQAKDHPRDDPGHRLHGDYVQEMLGSRDFYWFSIDASPSDSIHWMSDEEVEMLGLSTDGIRDTVTKNPFGEAFASERARVGPQGEAR